jgi:hypothetical protein
MLHKEQHGVQLLTHASMALPAGITLATHPGEAVCQRW